MAVLTISRQFGAGGRTLGAKVAKRLNYLFEDDVIIQEIARKAKVTKSSVMGHEQTAGSLISRILSTVVDRGYMERLTGDKVGYLDEDIYVETLTDVIAEFAKRDNVVLLGRAGQYILQNNENVFHILMVAEEADRIDFIMKNYNLSPEKARHTVEQGDKRRRNLYSKFAKSGYDNPMLYHLCLNMSRISIDKAVDLVCDMIDGDE
ncbi:MAG: cytidylate kinase-like family protein [Deltaproteobacteria bacterium]|nr:cytidylate kinase-like family protein [Deltaproteobacteria bacterium]